MIKLLAFAFLVFAFACSSPAAEPVDVAALAQSFAQPPATARPWVYWTWIDGNINKEGITADLEAMNRVGIGGAIILDVDQSTPHGPVHFFDVQWKALFTHAVAEAKRLGMEINMNDGAGYYGSGGNWVPPDKAMQTVVQSEVHIKGGGKWMGMLALPSRGKEYRDIAVLAVGETGRSKFKIPDFEMKALRWQAWIAYKGTQSAPLDAAAPADAVIPVERIVNLTGQMAADGSLSWDAPAGEWTIIRFGHAWNGHIVGPSVKGEAGPETDKLDKSATDLHFNAFVKQLNELVGAEGKKALVATHIDSWEGGGQNWTAAMREEFKKRRGYDPVPYLPILTGRVLGDLQITERFLFDLRLTVSDLMIENYSAEFQRLAHEAGLRNTFESYTTIGNDLDNAEFVDEPMAEFWTPNGQGLDFQPTVKSMSSAAHIYGRSVVGAESFTSGAREKFLWHPAMIKSIGDTAFCGGVSRFVFHRYAAQPFAENVKPGMQMGPWGLHYERTNTWWEFSKPWHEYLARCQYVLRQGTFVADVLKLETEEPLHRFQDITISGYDYDACGPATFLHGNFRDGDFTFTSGMKYRLIVLPGTPTMTVGLLKHIRDLVQAGAVVLGDPPQKTPGLTDYPNADEELKKLVDEMWGTGPAVTDRKFGSGRIFRGITIEKALTAIDVPPDFTSDAGLKFIHHTVGSLDIYFVSHAGDTAIKSVCSFRVSGKRPELWNAETGKISRLPIQTSSSPKMTSVSLEFDPSGSAFVVFRPLADGEQLLTGSPQDAHDLPRPAEPIAITGPWQLRFPAGWGAPPEVTLNELKSWSENADAGVKYFSGTATYSKMINLPAINADQRLILDLGKVQVMARVRLNGKDLGILWKPPYRVDISEAARPGENSLEIDVVNQWVNRLIGDEQLPEDSDRNKNGTLKSWPQWLLEGKPSPAGRFTFSSWRLWKKVDALQESGLIGPVTVQEIQDRNPTP